MLPQQRSNLEAGTEPASSRGFTLMIMGGPGRVPRRLYVPHWLCAVLLIGWLVVMVAAAWFGFQSAAATTGASATTAAVSGAPSASSLSSPLSRHV
jgi:hypothetical protein